MASNKLSPKLGVEETNRIMEDGFNQYDRTDWPFEVVEISPGKVHVRLNADRRHLRPGDTVSGPALFTLADIAGWACGISHIVGDPLIVTTNLNINFMRKAPAGAVDAHARILKIGRNLMVYDVDMMSGNEMVAHATGTYSIPPQKPS